MHPIFATTDAEHEAQKRVWPRILAYATQGAGGDDETRLRGLLKDCNSYFAPFHTKDKVASLFAILLLARTRRFDMIVMEGSGVAGGFAAILALALYRVPYVFSCGDAIAPFLAARFPTAAPLFWIYERLLYANAKGYIGWTPYLVGRALTMGASRAMTAPGWAPSHRLNSEDLAAARTVVRSSLGIPADAIVFGIVGALNWSKRFHYCYGLELVLAAVRAKASCYILIVGDGTGIERLRKTAGTLLNKTIFLPGRVSRGEVPRYLAAMDIGSLPQSVDRVGSFRYTTKLNEYLTGNLPFVTTQIPLSYDLDEGNLWRLPGSSPWDPTFLDALASLMTVVDHAAIAARKMSATQANGSVNEAQQARRVSAFLTDLLG